MDTPELWGLSDGPPVPKGVHLRVTARRGPPAESVSLCRPAEVLRTTAGTG
jgi:hypothetical protein